MAVPPVRFAALRHAEAVGVLCGKYSSTLRQVLEYSPQSTIRNRALPFPFSCNASVRRALAFPFLAVAAPFLVRGRKKGRTGASCGPYSPLLVS